MKRSVTKNLIVTIKIGFMKSVLIVFNQANTERVEYMLDELKINGFTLFEQVQGRGTNGGEPRRGTHCWPEMNSAVITVVEDEQVPELLLHCHDIKSVNPDQDDRQRKPQSG